MWHWCAAGKCRLYSHRSLRLSQVGQWFLQRTVLVPWSQCRTSCLLGTACTRLQSSGRWRWCKSHQGMEAPHWRRPGSSRLPGKRGRLWHWCAAGRCRLRNRRRLRLSQLGQWFLRRTVLEPWSQCRTSCLLGTACTRLESSGRWRLNISQMDTGAPRLRRLGSTHRPGRQGNLWRLCQPGMCLQGTAYTPLVQDWPPCFLACSYDKQTSCLSL